MTLTMINLMGVRRQQGEVGIEVEVEGRHLDFHGNENWRTDGDGSLRGNSCEYVLKAPAPSRSHSGKFEPFSLPTAVQFIILILKILLCCWVEWFNVAGHSP